MKREMRWIQVLLLGALTLFNRTVAAEQKMLSVSFGDRGAWSIFADESWWARIDMRNILNLFHPLSIPRTGNAAGASAKLTIPAGWRPPFALRFFCADDYFADEAKHKPGQSGTESFFGHRFKQVLIDDVVIWSRDVTDENTAGSQTTFQVDITRYVKPGKAFTLTMRAFDKVNTVERNSRDVWFIGSDGKTEEPPRFHTAVWFADAVMGEEQAVEAAPEGVRPHDAATKARHRARWPMRARGARLDFPAALELVVPARIPTPGFPLTCGIPMPQGLVTDAGAVRLRCPEGKPLAVQGKAVGLWPDGSVRFLLLNMIVPPGAIAGDQFHLHVNKGGEFRPEIPLRIARSGDALTIRTGALRIELGASPNHLIDAVYLTGENVPIWTDLSARMSVSVNGVSHPVKASWQSVEVSDEGPVVTCVELHGSLDTKKQHIGRFIFRLYVYAGLPTIQTQFRLLNDVKAEKPLEVTDLALVATLPGGIRGETALGIVGGETVRTDTGAFLVRQETHKHFTIHSSGAKSDEGRQAEGWIAVSGANGRVQASMRRFWQQYPKSLGVQDGRLEICLFVPTISEPAYRPRFGEAKRHDIWFTFSPDTMEAGAEEALGVLADRPPRLFDRQWFCTSGGVSVLDPAWFEHQPSIAAWAAKKYGDVSTTQVTRNFGIRNFGDRSKSNGRWANGYWATARSTLYWGLTSGNPRWFERSFEISRHAADVDSVHIPAGHPDWNLWDGVTCVTAEDHSVHHESARWSAFQQGDALILHYWMTGDTDSLQAAVSNADFILRSWVGLGSAWARDQARPMRVLLRVWQATGKPEYRLGAHRYLDLEFQSKNVIDWRRGSYIQPTYENWRCITPGLDSMYAHNVYEYYRLTGDVDAARLVVAIADSVYAESMLPQEEAIGSFLFYVRYGRNARYYTQMAMLFYMAYDLTEDVRFLRAGRAAFERYLLAVTDSGEPFYQMVSNFGWLDPEFGGWLLEFRDIPTRPFVITGQTPRPDPANYD